MRLAMSGSMSEVMVHTFNDYKMTIIPVADTATGQFRDYNMLLLAAI